MQERLHASAVTLNGRGVLVVGPSGSGKSSLCLQLMGLGADLIADDQCVLRNTGSFVEISKPADLPDLIEARGVGLIPAICAPPAVLSLVVDLGETSTERLPPARKRAFWGVFVAVLHKSDSPHFPAAICAYVKNAEVQLSDKLIP